MSEPRWLGQGLSGRGPASVVEALSRDRITLALSLDPAWARRLPCRRHGPRQNDSGPGPALSREPEFATRSPEVPVRAHAAVAARHVRNASSLRTRSVLRDVRWRWTLNVLWTAA